LTIQRKKSYRGSRVNTTDLHQLQDWLHGVTASSWDALEKAMPKDFDKADVMTELTRGYSVCKYVLNLNWDMNDPYDMKRALLHAVELRTRPGFTNVMLDSLAKRVSYVSLAKNLDEKESQWVCMIEIVDMEKMDVDIYQGQHFRSQFAVFEACWQWCKQEGLMAAPWEDLDRR
jgi:hypothetical protein